MKRKSKQKSSPIWPYLGILACLFLLSLTAPRAWEHRARRTGPLPERVAAAPANPIARTSATLPESPVALETADVEELAPRDSQLEIAISPAPALSVPELMVPELPVDEPLLPPAPEYADQIQLEPVEVANLPELPPMEPAAEIAPAPLELDPAPQPEPRPEEPLEPTPAAPQIAEPAPQIAEPAPQIAEPAPVVEESAAREPEPMPEVAEQPAPAWPIPRTLSEQLSELIAADSELVWSRRAQELVEEICHHEDDIERQHAIAALRELLKRDAMQPVADPRTESRVLRARYGLTRWLDIWEAASVMRSAPLGHQIKRVSLERMQRRRADFERLADGNPAASAWRDYLRLEELTATDTTEQQRRQLAKAVLERIDSPRLTAAQRKFLEGSEMRRLREDLQTWAARPIVVDELLANLERFEHSGLASDAAQVADDFESIRWSSGQEATALGKHLDTHYRNANLRVAVSGELAGRFIPQPGRIDAPVRDMVVNVPVRGHSSTFTKLSLILVPDARRIRLGLEAQGVVDANTISSTGPVTLRNRGQSTFLVRKLFVLGPRGLHVWPAIAEAENNYNYLVSLETDYDGVPIVGSLVRNIARGQHDEIRSEARRQTEQKVAIKALNQFDNEIQARLDEAEAKMKQGQLATLRRLGMELTPITLSTTEERIVGRVRLAGPQQLGAHTARPRAPSDSWLSLQLHESVLNNTLQSLDLEGRSFELEPLFAWVGQKLGRPELAKQEELPENVKITFAKQDAIRVRAIDDRVEVTVAIAELTHEGSRWRNFEVRTSYAAQADGLSPRFARVDTIHLDGKSLRGKIEFKLRAIFSKVLSKNRELKLLPDSMVTDAAFRDLAVTQFAIEDGWIALAYSPRRPAANVARRPK